VVPYVATATLLMLGLMLCGNGWSIYLTHQYREAANSLKEREDLPALLQQVDYLKTASKLNPSFAHLQMSLGRADLQVYESFLRQSKSFLILNEYCQLLMNSATNPGLGNLGAMTALQMSSQTVLDAQEKAVGQLYLQPALRAFQAARNS